MNHRAISSRVHAREITTALSSAGTKDSPAANARASAADASVLRSVKISTSSSAALCSYYVY